MEAISRDDPSTSASADFAMVYDPSMWATITILPARHVYWLNTGTNMVGVTNHFLIGLKEGLLHKMKLISNTTIKSRTYS